VEKKEIKVGIAGCGGIARHQHIPSLLKMNGVKIAAVCDANESLMEAVKRKCGDAAYYTDYTKMLLNEDLDIVDICTPPQTHAALSIQAAESGRHILVEKPLALSLMEFEQVAEACARNSVKICEIQQKMFEPVLLKSLFKVRRGDIGEVLGVEVTSLLKRVSNLVEDKYHWCHDLPGGIFAEVLPHPIYLTQAFLGKVEPVVVHVRDTDTEDSRDKREIRIIMEGRTGVGVIIYSGNSVKNKVIIDVQGKKKNMRIDLWNSTIIEYGTGTGSRSSRAMENLRQCLSLLTCSIGAGFNVITGRFHSGHYTVMERFIDCIRNDTEPPVSLEQSKEVIRSLDNIIKMAKLPQR